MMSDFLKNLRSGQDSQTNRYGNKLYGQENRQFPGNEKRIGIDRRSGKRYKQHSNEILAEMLFELSPAIKAFLESIAENQKRLAEVEEIRATAEEKKAKTFEGLLEYLKSEDFEKKLINSRENTGKRKKAKKPIDANRKKVMQIIAKLRGEGETFDNIALDLENEKLPTFSKRGQWHAQTIHRLYQDHILS
jgi:antitoxin component of RelBE/YafQ-DinJ toxin-antitoxin module